MVLAVKKFIKHASDCYKEENDDFKRFKWVLEDHPAQAICTVASINWCASTELMLSDEEDVKEGLEFWF
jgi:hypothetical protein